MPKTELLSQSYVKLLKQLKSILIEGLRKAQVAVERQKVRTYWQTGKLISKHLLENEERAVYGDRLFERLTQDLQIDRRTLEQSVKFYRTFPIPYTCTELGWSHYRLLIGIQDKQKRLSCQRQAIKQQWSVQELQEAISQYKLQSQDLTVKTDTTTAPKLRLKRSKLYTYRLIKPVGVKIESADLLVDCGFNFWRDVSLKGITKPSKGDFVESIKTEKGYRFRALEAKRSQLYTFKAFIERVTDADTIWVHIDLGFNSWSRQKIRFRGIDAPEVSTKKGQKAKKFVEATLAEVPFVVIKTHYPDKYDRYLSDVFYLPLKRRQAGPPPNLRQAGLKGEADPQRVLKEGVFLNQQLLDLGLARVL